MRTSFESPDMSEPIQLNERLIQRQGLVQADVDEILRLHVIKHKVFERMKALSPTTQQSSLRFLAQSVRQIEFQQQKFWKFTQDETRHGWFEVPHCACPKHDNRDRQGTPYKVINTTCPIHGSTPA